MRKIRTIEMQRLTVEEYRQAEKLPLIVVLDDVRSMYNIGSVFRTCDSFRVEAPSAWRQSIFVAFVRHHLPRKFIKRHWALRRVSAGATSRLYWRLLTN